MSKDQIKMAEAKAPTQTYMQRSHIHDGAIHGHLERINREFAEGFALLQKYPKSVTIFGSSLLRSEHPAYKSAVETAELIARELKYAVLTGGGPGIMEAANKGAFDAGGQSVGLNISLPHENHANAYLTDKMKFAYFFARKTMLDFAAEAYIYFPGGYGTFDELFSLLTLIQTGKFPRVPVILFDSKFWNPLWATFKKVLQDEYKTIDVGDLDVCQIVDTPEEVVEIIKKAPISEWWRVIN